MTLTKKEFAIFAATMKTVYHKEKDLLPNPEAMEIWYKHLCDIPYPVAEAALHKWTQTNKWSPSIAEIREMAATVSTGEIDDWGPAWEKVLYAVKRHGLYGQVEAMASLDELTRKAVRGVGFRDICLSENISVERANFRAIYQSLVDREKAQRQMSQGLKVTINRLQAGENKYLIEGE